MFNFKKFNRLKQSIFSVTAAFAMASTADAGIADLQQAEQYRSQYSSAHIVCRVDQYKNGELKKTRDYEVYKGLNKNSLVLFKSAADSGQKVLMKADKFWMFMPKSRRPIRITPMQKLLGEASLGDVATLSWSEQYSIAEESNSNNQSHLVLTAKDKGASYQKIELTLNQPDNFPLSANLYLASGKLSKVATFQRGELNDKPAVVAMELIDKMKKDSKTIIHYTKIEEAVIPERLFNPQILLRNDLSSILKE